MYNQPTDMECLGLHITSLILANTTVPIRGQFFFTLRTHIHSLTLTVVVHEHPTWNDTGYTVNPHMVHTHKLSKQPASSQTTVDEVLVTS
jgi:hypothetical protein